MGYITRCNGPFSLEDLTARILKSSNFRFEWQFYQVTGIDLRSPIDIRCALDSIIARPDLHRFLQESFQRMYHNVFEIEPLNKHCQIVTASDEFENILASAAGDHLGAYSRELRPANASEKQK